MDDEADALPGSISMNALNNNDNLESNTSNMSRNLFSEMSLKNGSGMTHDLEYLMSSTEENKETSPKTSFEPSISTPNGNSDVIFEPTDDTTETFTISYQAYESLGIVLGMNEIIDASEGEIRKVYVKKISGNGAMTRAMNESNNIRLGDEILAINESCIKNLSRNECLNLLINLPNEITMLLKRNKLPWTTGPRCSFYLNLVDKNPETILSPAPKLFTNEGKKIPDGYKLLEISLYKEASDLLGISIVPSYGDTRHYYQIKELEADGICSKSKLLNKGDCLVSCNGNSLHKIPFNQCLNILKSEGPSLTFEVFRKDDIPTTLEFHETPATYDDSSEVNNNDNNNNNNDDDDGNDSGSASTYTSELLIPSEIKLTESIKPILETNNQENLLDFTNFNNSDSKTAQDNSDFEVSPDLSDLKASLNLVDLETSPDLGDFKASPDLSDLKASPDLSDLQTSPDLSELVDFKASPDLGDLRTSPDLSELSDLKTSPDLCDLKASPDLSDFKVSADLGDLRTSSDLTELSDLKSSPDLGDFKASADLGDLQGSADLGDLRTSSDLSELSDLKSSPDLGDFKASADLGDLKAPLDLGDFKESPNLVDFKESPDLCDLKGSSDISDFKASVDISDFKASPDISDFKASLDISEFKESPDLSDLKASTDLWDFKASPDISDFKASPDSTDFKTSPDSTDFKASPDISDFKISAEISDFKESPDLSDFKASTDLCDFKAPDISDFKASPDISEFKASPDISESPNTTKSHLSSFECEVNNTLNKPLRDFLTGSPFTVSPDIVPSDSLQKPIEACPTETSLHPVIDEPCIQLTAEAVESSPRTDRSSQLNMSEQCPANDAFSLDGLEEFSNSVINNANVLNNNFSSSYPCSSNEDLISIDTDVMSPTISNPTLIFYNHADPWEAAGEAKSENLLPDFQMSQSVNHKNALNEFIDSVESPDYGSDPLDGLQENIMQVVHDEKCLSSPPTKFGTDLSKGVHLEPSSGNVSLDNDLVEEERTSPISYDDSLSGSIGIHTADEGDIPVSSRNSDSELIEEIPQSPDSGRADSPGVYKNDTYNQKDTISKLPSTQICVDIDKMTEEENSVYHTVSDISRKNKGSENHGSFDSSESCATSVGSFESCAETGEQDHFGNNSKHFSYKNEDSTKSLPRNAFSNFKEFQNSMFPSSNEKSSTLRSDARLFPFPSSNLKSDPNYGKSDYLKKFSDNLFSRNYRLERKSDQVRSEDKPFQVEVLKGIVGLGMTLKVDDEGFVKVTHIQNNTPTGQNGIIKVGDYILSINNTNIVGVNDSRVQQTLRLLPRGLIKVVASAVPISDWKQYTEDAEKLSVGNSGTGRVTVSLTSPIKMSDKYSSKLSGGGLNTKATSQKRSSISFSSALNIFSKDQSTDFAKLSPNTVPSISTSLQKNQCDKTETCVKSIGFSNNSKPSLPLDKNLKKCNSSYEPSPVSSPEVVLNQVRMFENYNQKNIPNQEIKEPIISSKQKLVEMFEPRNQKPEKDNKDALPDILQDHTNSIKKQFSQEVKNGTAKAIAKSYDAVNKTPGFNNNEFCEDVIVPVKTNKYRTFSSLPRSSSPRILDSFSMWDNMDSVAKENQNTVSQVKKTVSQAPKDPVKEELIIPKKKSSVQSLVNQFNSPQNSNQISYSSNVSKGFKATSDRSRNQSPVPAVVEESIEPIRKVCITNTFKPLPISFSEVYDIDEVLIIEKTEKRNAKPDLKMTLTGPYSTTVEVSEPQLKPEKKPEVKSMKRPVASPRKSYNLSPTRSPKDTSIMAVSEPEVSIGIARRLSQSAVPDCIDIINIPEMVPTTETAFHSMEDEIVQQVRPNRFEKLIESPKTKRAKAISLLSSMDDDINYKLTSASSDKQESKWFDSDRNEISEDQIIASVKVSAMSAKPRKIIHMEDAIVPEVRKSKARKYAQCKQNSNSSSSEDSNYPLSCDVLPRRTLKFANNKANEIVKSVIEAAEKELCRTNVSRVNKPSTAICDITGHTPWNDETDHPATISKSDSLEENVSQVEEPRLFAEIKTEKLSTQKRNLPLIENGRPKPMPRQSRQLSPATEISSDIFGEKAVQQSPKSKPDIQPSNLETDVDSQVSVRLHSPIPFRRSVSPSGGFRYLNESDSNKKTNFFSAPCSPMRDQKPTLFKQASPGCLESLLNSELQNSSRGRSLPSTPRHNVSRCLPNTPTEENKFVGRSLPSVPVQSTPLSSFSGHQIEFKTKTWPSQPVLSQVTSAKFVSPSVQLQDAPMDTNTSIKWTSYQFSPVESPMCQLETNQIEEKTKPSASPVPATKSTSLFTNQVDKVERVPSPVSLKQSSTPLAEDRQTEQEAPLMKSSFTLSSAAKTQPLEESEIQSALVRNSSLSTDSLESETPNFTYDELDSKETAPNNLLSLTDSLPEVKSEINIPTPPPRSVPLTKDVTDRLSTSEVERPLSLTTKPLDFKKETLTLSSPIKILNSSPIVPEVGEKSPVLAFSVSPSRNMTENHTPSPTSRSTLYLDTSGKDSSPPNLSPRRIGSTNRKLPDIFQSTHTFKTLNSPTKVKTFPEALTASEYVPIEKSVPEHKSQKITEVSNSEVVLSKSISIEPETASELKDPKLNSIEIIENIPKAEVAVSQCINIEPTRASALPEVKTEKHGVQVIEEVSKPEVAVSQFIGIEPTTATYLPEKKVKTHDAAVVEEIAKPEVAVSQFIGIKPTTATNLSSAKELKENKLEISEPENGPTANVPSVKTQEQNIEVLTGITSPKSEVAVSKFIGLQPTTATKLSQPIKRSVSTDDPKNLDKLSPHNRARLSSSTKPDIVASVELGRSSFSRHKSIDAITSQVQPTLRNSRCANRDTGTTINRRMDKVRPRSEIYAKEMPSIFSKRKWCISTKSGQTNFALPSEPATVDRVVNMGLIDEEDLDHLLTSANLALDKMSFSNNEEIHIAIMEKDATEKTGIRLKKGEKQELVISLLEPDGAAIKQKFIHVGDSLLLVNSKPAWNQTVMDVKMWLQTIETRMIFVLSRKPMDDDEAANDCEYMDIVLQKGVTGVGFCLEGGVGCPLGDRPISVKRIFNGGPAEKGGKLKVGDEILKVNDMDFQKQRHFVAWNHLKFLPQGDVKLHICRRKSRTAATKTATLQEANTDSTIAEVSA